MLKPVVFDTETACLNGPICDLGIIRIDEELNVVSTTETLINPGRRMAPAAQAVHGITDAQVSGAPTIKQYVETHGNPFAVAEGEELVLIGHNVRYDIERAAEAGLLPEKFTSICTLRMSRNQWPELKENEEDHKLGTLAIMFNLLTGPAHRAMGDSVTCLNLLRHIADVASVSSFEELLELGRRPLSLESKISFGKHKGTKLKDLPIDYVQWVCRQTDMDAELRAALAVRLTPAKPFRMPQAA